jgi:hypothetical protein
LDDAHAFEVLGRVKQLVVVLGCHQLVVQLGDLHVTGGGVLHQVFAGGNLPAVQSDNVLGHADDGRAFKVAPVLSVGQSDVLLYEEDFTRGRERHEEEDNEHRHHVDVGHQIECRIGALSPTVAQLVRGHLKLDGVVKMRFGCFNRHGWSP